MADEDERTMAEAAEPEAEDEKGVRQRRRSIILLSIAIILALAVGSTLAFFSDTDDGSAGISLSGPSIALGEVWDASAGQNYTAGMVMRKEPSATNSGSSDVYVRIRVRVVRNNPDGTRTLVTDPTELDLILSTIRYDPSNLLGAPSTGRGQLAMDRATVDATVADRVSGDFELLDYGQPGIYTYAYTGGNGGRLAPGETATLFTTVAIPSDYTSSEIAQMGNYSIDVWAESVSAAGLSDRSAAMDALESAYPTSQAADPTTHLANG